MELAKWNLGNGFTNTVTYPDPGDRSMAAMQAYLERRIEERPKEKLANVQRLLRFSF
jgi:hypothetical protein